MAYIDTSVLVAYYCPETLSGPAQKALARTGLPVISPLVELEFVCAMAMKVRAGELDAASARRILATLQRHLAEDRYMIVPVGGAEYELARHWVGGFSTPLRAPDALHLAAAFGNGLLLLTADRALARAAADLGVDCELIA